jgi:nitric oxide reductase NorD protein
MTDHRAEERVADLDRLRLLAAAIAGRDVEVAAAEPDDAAWTDGTVIFLDATATRRQQVEMLGVQASLLAGGSLVRGITRELARRPGLTRRYLGIEGHRALAANEIVLPAVVRRMIDHDIARSATSAEGSLRVARGNGVVPDPPRTFGTLHPRRMRSDIDRDAPVDAAAVRAATRSAQEATELSELVDEGDDGDGLGRLLSSPVSGGGAVGRVLGRLLTPMRNRGGGPPGADAPTHAGKPRAGGRPVVASTPVAGLDGPPLTTSGGRLHPEWDHHRRRYRPNWCTVIEIDAPINLGAPATIPDTAALRRSLARLGIGLAHCRRRSQGEDIDIDAVVEARVQTLAGSPSDDGLYVESVRRSRDLAVLVLLDVSGSSGEPGTGGRSVHDHQRSLALGLTAALHDLGDRVGLYAFNSRGRTAVQVLRVKAFDDRLDVRVLQRIHTLRPGAYTRLGAAIRHGTMIIDERAGSPRRLLVVVSDGFAYDHGYQGRYAEADARRSLLEARRRGVGCLCVSVGTDVDPAGLRRVFGATAHATLPTAHALPRVAAPLFRAALRSAEAHRRTFRRTERSKELLAIARGVDR